MKKEDVLKALSHVQDPDLKKDLAQQLILLAISENKRNSLNR